MVSLVLKSRKSKHCPAAFGLMCAIMDAPFITSVSVLFFIEHAMHDKPSFAGRIVLALILMVCFYALAVALAGTLIFLPVGMVVFANRIPLKLAILSLIGGCMILWSVMPRWDRFIAPGLWGSDLAASWVSVYR